jgi:hypothetical protein
MKALGEWMYRVFQIKKFKEERKNMTHTDESWVITGRVLCSYRDKLLHVARLHVTAAI